MERRKGSKSFNKEADIKPFCIHLSRYIHCKIHSIVHASIYVQPSSNLTLIYFQIDLFSQ